MKRIISMIVLLQSMHVILLPITAWSWNDEVTQRDLASYAVDQSITAAGKGNWIRSLGFGSIYEVVEWPGHVCKTETKKAETKCTIKNWLIEGAEKEDASIDVLGQTRTVNHFHDPTRDAGLSDLPFIIPDGISALTWVQDMAVPYHVRNDAHAEDAFIGYNPRGVV